MTIEVKVPVLPESVADATVAHWYKKPGDAISRDENLVDLETDKVMLEVPAPEDGVLEKIVQAEGATVTANELLAVIKPGAAPKKEEPAVAPKVETAAPAPKAEAAPQPAAPASATAPTSTAATLSPSARRKAAMGLAVPTAAAIPGAREEKRVPMSRLRAKVAERLVEVTQTTAMLTTFNEVNMKPVMDLRARYKEQFEKVNDVRLGFMSFFVKAAVEALKRFPAVNASIDGTDLIYHGYFDVGIAVSTERGLVVPVLRDADQMSMADVEKGIRQYAGKARENKITLEDMTGGTFTITNGGVFGSMLSTPIINPPQSAILGMHNIVERAVVENSEIVVRPMMYLAMSYDHRIIDGRESVTFLKTIKELLEDPARLMLGV